ncbi:hypothetical protein M0804_009324 [Polistes exclamans]|nr:hypothetical protein M0804_009324 [Polistes exclamans]
MLVLVGGGWSGIAAAATLVCPTELKYELVVGRAKAVLLPLGTHGAWRNRQKHKADESGKRSKCLRTRFLTENKGVGVVGAIKQELGAQGVVWCKAYSYDDKEDVFLGT